MRLRRVVRRTPRSASGPAPRLRQGVVLPGLVAYAKRRGAVSMCGSAARARPATTAPQSADDASRHFQRQRYRFWACVACIRATYAAACERRSMPSLESRLET
ncbi:hypothetical protein ACFQ10_27740 [Streptomyces indonesiensis]|uniref:Uncharacterized protein n=2 Tax=Streptomyces rhizosphaericus TaxID=114699 RepID=A0ABN1RS74_9ACTN